MQQKLFVLLIAILSFYQGGQSSLANTLLRASIQTSDRLPAIDPTLTPGATFDKGIATTILKSPDDNEWIQIPKWMAGEWKGQDTIMTYYRDVVSGEEDFENHPFQLQRNSVEHWGCVPSKDGWWEFADRSYWSDNSLATESGYCFIQKFSPVRSGADEVTATYLAITFDVDPESKQIQNVHQQESIQVYKRLSDNLMRLSGSFSTYDADGKLLTVWKIVENQKKLEEPKCVTLASCEGKSTAALFFNYLLRHQRLRELPHVIEALQSLHLDQTSAVCFCPVSICHREIKLVKKHLL